MSDATKAANRPPAGSELPVEFPGPDGAPIRGIWHVAAAPRLAPARGVVLVNAGLRQRVGPYRIGVRLARAWQRRGLDVLRCDQPGAGDSPGSIATSSEYRRRLIDDCGPTRAMIDCLQRRVGAERIALAGLCGGAMNVLQTAGVDRRVDALVLLSLPVRPLADLSPDACYQHLLQAYFRKLFDWRAWWNLVRLRSKFDVLGRAADQLLRRRAAAPPEVREVLDETLAGAFAAHSRRGGRTLFVYGDADMLWEWFQGEFQRRLEALPPRERSAWQTAVIAGAGHVFAGWQWQQELIQQTTDWLAGGAISAAPTEEPAAQEAAR